MNNTDSQISLVQKKQPTLKNYRLLRKLMFPLLISLVLSPSIFAKVYINLPISKSLLQEYQDFASQLNQPVSAITSIPASTKRRVVELIILQQALFFGDIDAEIDFDIMPSLGRDITEVKKGNFVMSSRIYEEDRFDRSVLKSNAIVLANEFHKAFYGLASNKALMNAKSLNDLQALSTVTVASWEGDVNILRDLNINKRHLSYNFNTIFNLIQYRDIDFVLLELPRRADLVQTWNGVTLVPVNNLLVKFPQSWHYMVSKKHPDGDMIYQALQKGLSAMREQGLIRKYLQQILFFHPKVKDWAVINNKLS